MSVLSVEELITNLKYSKESPLRVYLGAAAGVGKTYRMLQDGNLLLSRGVDVVIGYLEPHRRPETSAQVRGLTEVPRRKLVDDDAEGDDVGELLELDILALHLAPDRIRLLLAPLSLIHI